LWSSGDLPVDPGNALHVRVSKLRRALAAIDAPDLVHRDGSGYRLDLNLESVDAHRFAALVEAARRTGDPQLAVETYARALSMWRGDPLVDFAGAAWTLVEAGRLAELRVAAIAERADRMLTLGRFEQTVADLEPVVATHPTRERLVGQLMTALFNAGRQADALAAYAETRRALTDELGLDPSRELRSVMEQVLRHDPAIALADRTRVAAVPHPRPGGEDAEPGTPAAAESTRSVADLPLRLTSFVGRDRDLINVRDALDRSRLVTLAGPGGAGKTALGIEAARRAAGQFRDGARLVRLAAIAEPELLPQAVADALGLSIEGGTAVHHPLDVLVGRLAQRDVRAVLDRVASGAPGSGLDVGLKPLGIPASVTGLGRYAAVLAGRLLARLTITAGGVDRRRRFNIRRSSGRAADESEQGHFRRGTETATRCVTWRLQQLRSRLRHRRQKPPSHARAAPVSVEPWPGR